MEKFFKKAHRLTFSVIVILILLGIFAASISQPHGYGGSSEAKMNFLRLIVFFVSLIQIGMAFVIRKTFLSMKSSRPTMNRFFTAQIMANIFCMMPAIFGLMLTFMTRSFWDYGIFTLISLAGLGFFFPKKEAGRSL